MIYRCVLSSSLQFLSSRSPVDILRSANRFALESLVEPRVLFVFVLFLYAMWCYLVRSVSIFWSRVACLFGIFVR